MATFNRQPIPGLSSGAMLSTPYRQHPRYKGIVGHWPFVEGGGTKVRDFSGYGNDGTLSVLTGADWVRSPVGGALSGFTSGTDDTAIKMGNPDVLNPGATGAWSMSVWFLGLNDNSDSQIVSKQELSGGGFRGYNIQRNTAGGSAGQLEINYIGDNTSTDRLKMRSADNVTATFNLWYHIVAVMDATRKAAGFHLYLDGAEISTTTELDTLGDGDGDLSNTIEFQLGQRALNSAQVNGEIGAVRIADRAWTSAEALSLFLDPYLEFRRPRLVVKAPAAAAADLVEPPTLRSYAITRAASW